MDLENVSTALEVRKAKLNLSVQTAGAKQCRVECVGPVGRHQDLDVSSRVKAIQL